MSENSRRPFYSEYAWAFDLLIDRPVRQECAAIVGWLIDRGIRPGEEVLDAGCGTGRYAIELARRGYAVHGVDLSPDLIDIARHVAASAVGRVSFTVGNIADLPPSQYAAILCRGVLNDIVDDTGREEALAAFAKALRSNGVVILDVRDWDTSAVRKRREPIFRKRVATERGELTFTSNTALDPERRQLLISERHQLVKDGVERVSDYEFVMRCWTRGELEELLARHGFGKVTLAGAYNDAVAVGSTDRLVALAQQQRTTA